MYKICRIDTRFSYGFEVFEMNIDYFVNYLPPTIIYKKPRQLLKDYSSFLYFNIPSLIKLSALTKASELNLPLINTLLILYLLS